METYEHSRLKYKPKHIKMLLIAESPPPAANIQSSRQFYRTDRVRRDDRLFVNTVKAIYPQTVKLTEAELEANKEYWLKQFRDDGWYMIEALEESQVHEVTKKQRQQLIMRSLPRLLERVSQLATAETAIILIKSNVFEITAAPLREAGYRVLNRALLDYPGHFNQSAYREKLSKLIEES